MSLLAAFAFLTVMPLPGRWRLDERHLSRATPWFPVVGLALGAILAGADHLLAPYLAQPARDIVISDVLAVLGGRLFTSDFCEKHTGEDRSCSHAGDCSIRMLWSTVQHVVDRVLSRTTLEDLLESGHSVQTAGLVSLEPHPAP